jgi:hypothetical protein
MRKTRHAGNPPWVIAYGLAFTIATSGCALADPFASYQVAQGTSTAGPAPLASLIGTLGGRTNGDGTACFWIDNGGARTLLVWPSGYSGGGSPLGIVDATGRTVARVGQLVELQGGTGYTGRIFGCSGTQDVFHVVGVISAHGA